MIASLVAEGKTDEEILTLAEYFTLLGYTVEQTRQEFQKMIDGARLKGFAKSGEILQENTYLFSNNQIYLSKFVRSDPVKIKLTNFHAAIIFETTLTNGIDHSKVFTIEGALRTGQPLPSFDEEAVAFDKLEWLPTHWGVKAQVTVGPMHRAHVAAAIKERSKPTERTVYSCTGWIEKNNKFRYLTNR